MAEIKLSEHPDYKAKASDWERWQKMYEGKHEDMVSVEMLWPHLIETKKGDEVSALIRSLREKRTRYLNLMEILVSIWVSYFMRKPPVFDAAAQALLKDAMQNVDGDNNTFGTFLKWHVLPDLIIYGKSITLVTKPVFEARNQAQYVAEGARPFFEQISPLSFKDWSIERDKGARLGRYNAMRYEYLLEDPRDRLTVEPSLSLLCDEYAREGDRVSVYRYKLEKASTSGNTESKWTLLETIPLDVSEIPVAVINSDSWVDDAAEETLRFHNIRSNKDNIEYQQGYRTRAVIGPNLSSNEARKGVNEYTTIYLPEGSSVWESQPVDTASMERSLQQALDNVFKVGLNIFRTLPSDSRAAQASDSLAEEKSNAYDLVESSLEELENYANKLLQIWGDFEGGKNPGTCTLNKDITQQDIDNIVEIYSAFKAEIDSMPTTKKAVLTRVVSQLDLSAEDQALADKEIEQVSSKPKEEPSMEEKLLGAIEQEQ